MTVLPISLMKEMALTIVSLAVVSFSNVGDFRFVK